ncbi:unnamed protein product [Camellia sinensis]
MNNEYTDCYYSGDDKSTALTGRKEMVFMANLCAFQFWQRVYKDKLRLDQLKQLLHFDEMKAALVLAPEEEWCSFHNLVQPSLNHVAEIYEDILNSVHRFRPKFLATADGLPLYYEPYEFQHTCLLTCQKNGNTDTMAADDEHSKLPNEKWKCNSVPFVPSSYFLSHEVAKNLATIIKEFNVQNTYLATNINTLMVMVLLPLGNLLYVNFLSKGCATGATNAHFLIHFKQKDQSASSSFLSRLLNVYAPKFETGGTFWPVVHSPAFVFLYQFSLLYSMTIAGNVFYPYSKLILLRIYSDTEVKTISTKYALKMATIPDLNMDCEAIMDNYFVEGIVDMIERVMLGAKD